MRKFILLTLLFVPLLLQTKTRPIKIETEQTKQNKPVLKYKKSQKSYIVSATVYNADVKQCNTDVTRTADLTKIDTINPYKHRIIAVSRDLLKYFKMSDTVIVSGTKKYDGIWYIHDKMNKRWKMKIDFLINKDMGLGKWKNIEISKYKKH